MANFLYEVLLTDAPLKALPQMFSVEAGAIVDFWGVVRRLEDKREIDGIGYEAHRDMADHQLRQIARQAGEEFALEFVVIRHRIGFVGVGEPSLFVRVCSPHRQEGFRAIRWIVDELKKKVTIWKKPRFQGDNSSACVVDAGAGSSIPATTSAASV
jgi:molybdopterin synthase catalytic subunit